MRHLFPLALLSAGCTIHVVTPLPERSDASVDVGEDELEDASQSQDELDGVAQAEDAGASDVDASADASAHDAGASMDGGSAETNDSATSALDAMNADVGPGEAGPTDAGAADAGPIDASVCGPNPLRKLAPELRIVLDRSGSMRPGTSPGLDCRNTDLATVISCQALGIDCSVPAQMATINCGGDEPPPDHWAPAVAALKAYTGEQSGGIDFGLTVFPGPSDAGQARVCATGVELVPIAADNAGAIATALDGIQPSGNTPTAGTLAALATQIEARKAQLGARLPPQLVLLLTDGVPTCAGDGGSGNVQAHVDTLAALDALAQLGVKTWVAGFDTEPGLPNQLAEYAVHGGTGSWHAVEGASMPAAIADATRASSACSYALDHALAGTDVVSLDGHALTRDAADGFVLRGTSLQLQGAACATMRQAGTHTLSVAWSCVP